MDADELERLCSALLIQELEGPAKSLDEGMKTRRERKLAFCLVGKIGLFLGKLIGDVKKVDLATAREENNFYLRVRVTVLISEPLVRSLRVDFIGTMLLRYERLQDYCFKCRRIGHVIRESPFVGDIGGDIGGEL
ncbi:hypothetical protein Q3G72_023846 [Acer saccharum]|nr:hypothetical protein Q3G72_023846 [Acer saccharum]